MKNYKNEKLPEDPNLKTMSDGTVYYVTFSGNWIRAEPKGRSKKERMRARRLAKKEAL